MKYITLILLFIASYSYGQGEINGKDDYDTTYYNTVSIYDNDNDKIASVVFSYDTYYNCDNNIKVYNKTSFTGYVNLSVYTDGRLKYNKRIYVEAYEYTYLDDAFRDCESSFKSLNVTLRSN